MHNRSMNFSSKRRSGGEPKLLRQVLTKDLVSVPPEAALLQSPVAQRRASCSRIPETHDKLCCGEPGTSSEERFGDCRPLRNFGQEKFFYKVTRGELQFGDIIGKGGFGNVHAGSLHGRPVAIKVIQKRRGSGIHREILQAERLAFTLNLRHENIVNILGLNLCDEIRGDALIIMELVSTLTLQCILDDHTRDISQAHRIKYATEISKALCYLHSNDVVHLDVKPRNVLMTQDNTCKLADFGSLTITRKNLPREEVSYTQILGTLPYRAPELMQGSFPSSKADVYSLGITLWQLATRETPHRNAHPQWLIYQVIKGNHRPDHHDTGDDDMEVKYRDLYVACWDSLPHMRPHTQDIVKSLNELLNHLSVCDNRFQEPGGRGD